MQRRAAGAYFLFFLVLSVGAYVTDMVTNAPAARSHGLVTITVMSGLAAILVIGLAYLPVRG